MQRQPAALVCVTILFAAVLGGSAAGCQREAEAPKIVAPLELQVFAADGTTLAAAILTEEAPLALAEGQYVIAQWNRYTGKAGGGELELEDGKLESDNLEVTKEN